MTANDKLLKVKALKMHFPASSGSSITGSKNVIRAVDGIDFSLKKGETLGLVGESGCGKSTTARGVAQLIKPTAGEVVFRGQELTSLSSKALLKARQNIQMVFQDPYASLNPRMTAGDIIAEPLTIYRSRGLLDLDRTDIIDRVESLMEKVGLSRFFRNRYPHEFSGGQRQRIGIARALALNPELILADEPVSALDVSIQAQILNLFKDLQQELALTYLFIAHDLAVIKYLSTRIAVMYLGVIVELARNEDLFTTPLHPYTQALLSAAPIPDPLVERQRQRIILSGDVPSPDKERHECYFYERCSKRMDICKQSVPILQDLGDNHKVACFLYHKPT